MNSEQQLTVIKQLGEALAKERDLGQFLKTLSECANMLASADRCSIFVVDDTTSTLWSQLAEGMNDDVICINVGQGIVGLCAEQKQPIIVDDASTDSRFFSGIDRATGYKTKTILSVPMFDAEQKVIGVFQLLNKKNGQFTSDDVQMVSMLAVYAGIMLDNALLHNAMQKRFDNKSEALIERNLDLERANAEIVSLIREKDELVQAAAKITQRLANVILGELDCLYESDAKAAKNHIRRMRVTANLIGKMFSSYTYSRSNLPPRERLNISEILRTYVAEFSDVASFSAQVIKSMVDSDVYGKYRICDLDIIFHNILLNAIKYGPEGGVIDVKLEKHPTTAILSVADSGPGIANKERIFRENHREIKDIAGFGKGLQVVKLICVEEHIKISVSDNKPSGSIFTLEFFIDQG
ncbi:MAG: GAF domain-containing sensor histidine kinase [Helicobacteraceae bacterium]|jgi:signal transduction histidine kinase|nr:GAF domain-containing sensor histidine kinase [Helicobacteraceae bacterium]